jgi:DNA topoisomerase-6 subunit B
MYLNRRQRVKQEGERRSIFLRYLREVATAVSDIQEFSEKKKSALYERLLHVAKRKTTEADTKLDDRGKKIEQPEEEFGDNVLIVEPSSGDQA